MEIKILGTDKRTPKWVINMASEYAEKHGLGTITLDDFFESEEYQKLQTSSRKTLDRINQTDIDHNS